MTKKKFRYTHVRSKETEMRKEALLNALKIQALFSQTKITIVETSQLVH